MIIAVLTVMEGMIEGKRVVVDVVGMYASIPSNFKTTAMCNVIKR